MAKLKKRKTARKPVARPMGDAPVSSRGALRLLRDINEGIKDPRTLTTAERRAVVMILYSGGQRKSAQIAGILNATRATITSDIGYIRKEIGRSQGDWSPSEVIGDLAISAEDYVARALKEGDVGLAWTIKKDFAKMLKDFGMVGSQEEERGFRITIESIGEGYERASEQLKQMFDPSLTGEIIKDQAPNRPQGLPFKDEIPGNHMQSNDGPEVEIVVD